ncbi:hypothetical protein UFOVP121_4 [uncultured Caudovirales phage]|uniref:Uncharacterized protein n=1 Tax=uncultured Caudovirales phage TaxID=2100421 RepID=A0A6J5LNU1_9CAUD|nr:hypothetical protein UFOVP121_4 [uncultured Caudovirales phage]CAB4134750.1 hypothetical protein UFOVP277_9 [uncultured Caudovirales phage]
MPRIFDIFKSLTAQPTPESIALRELEEAKRELLRAQSLNEYAAKMSEYHQGKIKRLTTYLKAAMKESEVSQNGGQ